MKRGRRREKGVPRLEDLAIAAVVRHCRDAGPEAMAELEAGVSVRVVEAVVRGWVSRREVGKPGWEDHSCTALVAAAGPRMEDLDLSNGGFTDAETCGFVSHALVHTVVEGTSLAKIDLSHASLPDANDLAALSLPPTPSVTSLSLAWCARSLDDDVLAHFVRIFPNTSILSLRGAGQNLSSAGIVASVAHGLSALSSVDLAYANRVDDDCVTALLTAHGFHLSSIDLASATRVSDASLFALCDMGVAIRSFSLTGLPRVTLAGLRALQAAFPNIENPLGHPAGRRQYHFA